MTTLSAHTTRAIHNKGMQAVYGIAAEYDVPVEDVIALLGTTSHTSITGHHSPFVRLADTTPSQPLPSSSQAPAADPSTAPPVDEKADEVPVASSAAPIPGDAQFRDPNDWEDEDNAQPASPSHQAETLGEAVAATGDDAASDKPAGASAPAVPVRGRPDTTRAKVVAVHLANPSWPSKLIAEHLGISEDAVRATASRKNLKLVSWWDYQREQAKDKIAALRQSVQQVAAPTPQPEPEQPPATIPAPAIEPLPSLADQVRECTAANPTWTAEQIAEHLGLSWRQFNSLATRHQIPVPAAPPPNVTLADKIRAHLVDHPDATLREVTDAIGANMQSVGWAAQKAGIKLRKRTSAEISEATSKAIQARKSSRFAEPPRHLMPSDDAIQPDETVMSDPQSLRSFRPSTQSSSRFYLRDAAGRYVHGSLERSPTDTGPLMTANRTYAWCDNAQRYRGALKLWPEIATLRKEGASK